MSVEDRKKIYTNVWSCIAVLVIVCAVVVVLALCHLSTLSAEHLESPGSHAFHSVVASLGSIGATFAGQIEASIPLAVDGIAHAFDFFDASSKQAAHDRSVASTQNTIFWSSLICVPFSVVLVFHERLEEKIESILKSFDS